MNRATEPLIPLHTWIGLICGWVLFPIFVTGSLTVFAAEIDAWMRPALRPAAVRPAPAIAAAAAEMLRRTAPDASAGWLLLPGDGMVHPRAIWWTGKVRHAAILSADGKAPVASPPGVGARFFQSLHWRLGMPRPTGLWIVGACTVGLLLAIAGGIWIHRRIFADFFTWQRRASASRQMRDLHTIGGVAALPFMTMIAYTGLLFFSTTFLPGGVDELYGGSRARLSTDAYGLPPMSDRAQTAAGINWDCLGSAVEQAETTWGAGHAASLRFGTIGNRPSVVVRRHNPDSISQRQEHMRFDGKTCALLREWSPGGPGVRLQALLTGLHTGQFGGSAIRWLYFLGGVAGAAAIGGGIVLFSLKRREKPSPAYNAIARIGVAALPGVLVACAVFLWSSRLPAAIGNRMLWEPLTFWAAWSLALAHALIRPPRSAWRSQTLCAGILWAGLPILDIAATGGAAAAQAAGVNLTALVFGLCCAAVSVLPSGGRPRNDADGGVR